MSDAGGTSGSSGSDSSNAPLLSRLASRLVASLLGSSSPPTAIDIDIDAGYDSDDKRPVPPTPIDARWLGLDGSGGSPCGGGGELPRELLLAVLAFLPPKALGAFAVTCRGCWGMVGGGGGGGGLEADAQELYRALLLREVAEDLPVGDFGLEELDWRRCLRRWTLGQCQWRPLPVDGQAEEGGGSGEPPPRFLHRVAFAPKGRISYCAGGMGADNATRDDLWRLEIVGGKRGGRIRCTALQWDRLRRPSPPARFAASFTLLNNPTNMDNKQQPSPPRALLFGGLAGGGPAQGQFLDDLWAWDAGAGAWAAPWKGDEGEEEEGEEEEGPAPCARWGHSMVACGGWLFLFGGSSPGQAYGDFWVYDPLTPQRRGRRRWRELLPYTPPPTDDDDDDPPTDHCPHPRGGHSATVVGGRYMYLFGGNTLAESFGDCWRVDLEAAVHEGLARWERVDPSPRSPAPAPAPRIGHVAFAVGPRLYIVGGRDFISGAFHPGPGHVLDTRTHRWSVLPCAAPGSDPDAAVRRDIWSRTGAAFIPHPAGGVVFGGLLQGNRGLAGGFWLLDVFGLLE